MRTRPGQLRASEKPLRPKVKPLRQRKANRQSHHPVMLRSRHQASPLRHRAKPLNQHIPNNLSADHLNERLDLLAFIHGGIEEVKPMQPFAAVFDHGFDLNWGGSTRK